MCRLRILVGAFCCISPVLADDIVKPNSKVQNTVLEQAQAHLKSSKPALGETLLVRYLQTQPNAPDSAECALLLGKLQAKQNRDEDALRTFSGIVSRYPKSDFAADAIAEQIPLYLVRRNKNAAEMNRNDLLANYPQSPVTVRIWSATAKELFAQEKFIDAVEIYQKIEPSLDSVSKQNFLTAKIFADAKGDPEKLLSIADQALREDRISFATPIFEQLVKSPESGRLLPKIQTKLAWCLYLNDDPKQLDRAQSLWRDVIKNSKPTDPWYAESKWHLVQLHSGPKNQWKEAVVICSEIVREQARGTTAHEQALFAKAWLLTVHDQGKLAVAAFDDLFASYPEKMNHQAIIQHRERALKSAAKIK